MKLSVKSDYAARAVLGLARHYPHHVAVSMDQVAEEQGLPPKYLPQILLELKTKGIVRSVRGMAGGYLLARAPAEITLGDVLQAVDGPLFDAPGLSSSGCPPELRRAWHKLRQVVEDTVGAITFQQLLEESAEKEKNVLHLRRFRCQNQEAQRARPPETRTREAGLPHPGNPRHAKF